MKTVIEMARECGLLIDINDRTSTSRTTSFYVESFYFDIENFASLVRADEKAQRTWIGLRDEEIKLMDAGLTSNASFYAGALWAEAKLKEKNT